MKDPSPTSRTESNETPTNKGSDCWKGLILEPFSKLEEFKQMVSTAFMKFDIDSSGGLCPSELLPMMNEFCEVQSLPKPNANEIGIFFPIKKTAYIVDYLDTNIENEIS
jgi:hypothetical protein